jgi:hypothetical protein
MEIDQTVIFCLIKFIANFCLYINLTLYLLTNYCFIFKKIKL